MICHEVVIVMYVVMVMQRWRLCKADVTCMCSRDGFSAGVWLVQNFRFPPNGLCHLLLFQLSFYQICLSINTLTNP